MYDISACICVSVISLYLYTSKHVPLGLPVEVLALLIVQIGMKTEHVSNVHN